MQSCLRGCVGFDLFLLLCGPEAFRARTSLHHLPKPARDQESLSQATKRAMLSKAAQSCKWPTAEALKGTDGQELSLRPPFLQKSLFGLHNCGKNPSSQGNEGNKGALGGRCVGSCLVCREVRYSSHSPAALGVLNTLQSVFCSSLPTAKPPKEESAEVGALHAPSCHIGVDNRC